MKYRKTKKRISKKKFRINFQSLTIRSGEVKALLIKSWNDETMVMTKAQLLRILAVPKDRAFRVPDRIPRMALRRLLNKENRIRKAGKIRNTKPLDKS